MPKHIQQGDVDVVVCAPLHDGDPASPITGLTTVVLLIWRESDRWFYDFNDSTFKASGHTTIAQQMSELDATNAPGAYYHAWTTPAADNTYHYLIKETGASAKNVPQDAEVMVGQWMDDIDQALSATESNIRGSDSDDLKDISDEIAAVQADTDDIQTRLPAALVGGRMDSDVGNMQTDTVDADALAADAVAEIQSGLATAAALANAQTDIDDIQARLPAALVGGRMDSDVGAMQTDVVDANALAADAVAEIQAGLATSAALAAVQVAILTELTRLIVAKETTSTAGSSPTEIQTPLTEADDFYNNMMVFVINAAGVVARRITGYLQTNGAITVDALPFTPADGDPVIIVARPILDSGGGSGGTGNLFGIILQ